MKSFRTLGLVALLALALITGVVYLVLTYVAPMDASLRSATLLTAVLAVLLIGPFVHQVIWRRKLYVLEPLIIFSLYIFLGYISPIPSFVVGSDVFTHLFGATFYTDLNKSLSWALVIVILGVIGFYLGHAAVRFRRRNPSEVPGSERPFNWNRERLLTIGIIYTVAGISLFGVGVVLLGGFNALLAGLYDRLRLFAGLNYFIQSINLLAVVSLIWWVYLLREGRQFRSIAFWVYSVFALLLGCLQGNKSFLFIVVLSGAVLYHILHKKIAPLTAAAGAVVVFFVLTIFALFSREYLSNGHFTTIDPNNLSETLPTALETEYGGNFIQIQALTLLVDRMPADLPYQHGTTYLSLFTLVVPRALWPGKLLPSTGVFTLAFRPQLWLDQGTTVPPGLMGEMYMNFGAAGVFVGMLLSGILIGRAVGYVEQHPNHPRPVLVYALLTATLPHYLQGDFVGGTAMFAIFILPLLFALWFIERQPGRLAVRARRAVGEVPADTDPSGRRLGAYGPTRVLHLRGNRQPYHR